jgi:type VI secretion system protein ImpJ
VSRSQRVAWSEGMLLSPQHLQQWDRFVHELVDSRVRSLHAFDWGFTRLSVDEEALRNGRFALVSVEGAFEDGTPFSAPGLDQLPPSRQIDPHLTAKQDTVLVSLGLPIAREGISQLGELTEPGKQGPRYSAATAQVLDLQDGASAREVTLAAPNLCVLFPDESLGEYEKLPVAEVIRAGEKSFRLRQEFIPPVLRSGASRRLMELLNTILEMTVAGSNSLSDKRHQTGATADFAAGDLKAFGRLYAYNALIPQFQHLLGEGGAHPEAVYLALAACLGQLCTFSTEIWAKELPAYNHRDLERTFEAVFKVFGDLGVRPDVQTARFSLEQIDEHTCTARIADPTFAVRGVRYFFGVRADEQDEWIRAQVPEAFKLAAPSRIENVFKASLRGIPLQRLARMPAEPPAFARHIYFELDPDAEEWGAVRSEQAISIRGVLGAAGLHLDLVAWKP